MSSPAIARQPCVHSLEMWPFDADVGRSVVCLSVCLCVGHTDEPCKNDRISQAAIWGRLMWVQRTVCYVGHSPAPPGEYD